MVQDTPVATVKRGQSGDMQREYNRQRNNLERNVEALKGSIDKVRASRYIVMYHLDKMLHYGIKAIQSRTHNGPKCYVYPYCVEYVYTPIC